MKLRRGDIVAFDFPFSDEQGSKVRPALVVSSNLMNERTSQVIIAAISRSIQNATERQLLVDPASRDGAKTGLRAASMIQCDRLRTVDQKLILGLIGKLSAPLQKQVDGLLRAALGL
jgi:mRNA interferase MazF